MEDHFTVERNHYLIIPNNRDQREVCERVERAAHNTLLQDYHVRVNAGYLTTFACVYVESLVATVGKIMQQTKDKDASINFLDMFAISAGNRDCDVGDKDGNINITFTPGPVTTSILERDYAPIINPEAWQGTIINEVEKHCSTVLSLKHKAFGDKLYLWTLIAFVYFEYVFRTMKLMAKEAHESGKMSVSFNFLEMFEIHCNLDVTENPQNPEIVSEQYTIKLRPGFQSKLLIKNDGVTEDDT